MSALRFGREQLPQRLLPTCHWPKLCQLDTLILRTESETKIVWASGTASSVPALHDLALPELLIFQDFIQSPGLGASFPEPLLQGDQHSRTDLGELLYHTSAASQATQELWGLLCDIYRSWEIPFQERGQGKISGPLSKSTILPCLFYCVYPALAGLVNWRAEHLNLLHII